MPRLGVVAALTALLLVPPAVHAAEWTEVSTHPQASSQPTAYGRTIRALEEWNGRLYAGYGDYGANTGPISVTPFNPSTGRFEPTVHTAHTEAVFDYRILGGNLYAAHIDPRGGGDYSLGTSGGWANRSVVSSLHVFDIAEHAGSLWMAGSSGRNAVVWRSTDGGSSWSVSLSVPPIRSDDYARFYFLGIQGNRLYAQGRDLYHNDQHPQSRVLSGGSWANGPDLIGTGLGQKPEQFADRMAYLRWTPGHCTSLHSFDGSTVRSHSRVYDFTVDGGYLYALDCQGRVLRTTNLSSWTTVTPALPSARSVAVVDGAVYVGTTDAKVHRHRTISSPDPRPSPTASPSPTTSPTASPSPTPGPSPGPEPTPRVCLLFICF